MLQKLKQAILLLVLLAVACVPLAAAQSSFASPAPDSGGAVKCPDGSTAPALSQCEVTCFDLKNKVVSCNDVTKIDAQEGGGNCKSSSLSQCGIMTQYVYPLINFLTALVGVAVTISIIVGGIQYASSAGDPQAASAARKRITNAIIALVVFIFLYSLLNFLMPGGFFNK